jgi:hypothetical protein
VYTAHVAGDLNFSGFIDNHFDGALSAIPSSTGYVRADGVGSGCHREASGGGKKSQADLILHGDSS